MWTPVAHLSLYLCSRVENTQPFSTRFCCSIIKQHYHQHYQETLFSGVDFLLLLLLFSLPHGGSCLPCSCDHSHKKMVQARFFLVVN